MINDQTGEH